MEAGVREICRDRDAEPGEEDRDIPSKDDEITAVEDTKKVRSRDEGENAPRDGEVHALLDLRNRSDVPAVVHEQDDDKNIDDHALREHGLRERKTEEEAWDGLLHRKPPQDHEIRDGESRSEFRRIVKPLTSHTCNK